MFYADIALPVPLAYVIATKNTSWDRLGHGELYENHLHHGIRMIYINAFGMGGPGSRLHEAGFANESLVEVRHRCCDGCALGFWMSLATGSGIFYRLGRTITFAHRAAACAAFLPRPLCLRWKADRMFPERRVELRCVLGLRWAARDAGYDSIQYVNGPGRNFEIVDLRDGDGSEHCARDFELHPRPAPGRRALAPFRKDVDLALEANYTAPVLKVNQSCHPYHPELFRSGWGGSTPCRCDPSLGVLNCRGTASEAVARASQLASREHW